ncbi:MAG TPA: hypothetical protein VHX86_07620 [Tepidisphaeraceae bacterium]|nr:hypothetical protein [Tepidisphaeraceae bacterium]
MTAPIDATNSGEKSPRIQRGRIDSLSVYEVTDYELGILEHGSPSSTYLNFALPLISQAIALLIVLITQKIDSQKVFTILVVLTVVGFVVGSLLMVIWWRTRTSVKGVIAKIRSRIP